MTNELDRLAADFERVFEEHRPAIESALTVAETAAVAIDPQLAAVMPLFAELSNEGKAAVASVVQMFHHAGVLRAASPDPTSPVPAAASTVTAASTGPDASPTGDASGPSNPPLVVGPPVA